jgi:uncharacterized protein (DUF488 family)
MSSRADRRTPAVVATIGYEGTAVPGFLDALREAGVQLVVDVRAVASSRRPGFAKTRLAANLEEAGIGYVHLRGLGTPSDGRAAARSGRHSEMQRIFSEHLATSVAEDDMQALVQLVQGGQRTCLLCFEADPAHCHRSIVAAALAQRIPIDVRHLTAVPDSQD